MVTKKELIQESSTTDDTWEPAGLLEELEGLDRENFTYRWCLKDSTRQRKLKAEHWVLANELEGDSITHRHSVIGKQDGNTAPDGSTNFRELVLMKLPKKWAEARQRYHREKSQKAMSIVNQEVDQASGGRVKATFVSEHAGEKVTIID
jgi:hypothetical protein